MPTLKDLALILRLAAVASLAVAAAIIKEALR